MKKNAHKKNKKNVVKATKRSAQKKAGRKKSLASKTLQDRDIAQKSRMGVSFVNTQKDSTAIQENVLPVKISKNDDELGILKEKPQQYESVPLAQVLAEKVLESKSAAEPKPKEQKAFTHKNTPKTVQDSSKSSPPKKGAALYGRKAFYYYISILICMFFIESHRFSLYFEDASNEYPIFAHVSEIIENAGKASGISTLMTSVNDFITELSQEQILEAHKPFDEQWLSVLKYYKEIFGLHSSKIAEITNKNQENILDAQQTSGTQSEKSEEKDSSSTLVSILDPKLLPKQELTPGSHKESQVKPRQESQFDSQREKPKKTEDIKPVETQKAEEIKPTEAQKTEIIEPEKSQKAEEIEQKDDPIEDKKEQKVDVPSQVAKPQEEMQPKEITTPVESTPVHYAFYDPQNIVPAPTKMALDEYTTFLPDLGQKKKILLVGDSMMQGLVPLIQTALKHRNDLEIVHRVKVSTGLSNQRFFHWPDNLKKLLKQHNPHVVIVCIGANDPQDLIVDKKWYRVSSDAWEEVYSMRTINFLELATSENRKVVWIGLPIMLKEPYAKNIKRINKVFKEVNSFYPAAAFVDTHMLLTDKGKFISFITGKNNKTIRVRAKDNIHLTFAGGRLITNYMIPTLNEKVGAARLDDVKGNPLIPVAGKANTITFTSHIQKKKVEYIAYLPNPEPKKAEVISVAMRQEKNISDWKPFISTAQATGGEQYPPVQQKNAPANIVAVQKNADNPPAVETLIAQSLQKNDVKQSNARFPVLYLLHGATGNGRDWNVHMGKELQKIADEKKVIIVAPSTGEYSWYVNSPLQKKSQIESFMLKELVPHVDALLPSNGKRGIAGLSMGGHGALLLSLKHPKTFSSTASASGVLDIRLHPEQWQINKLLGNYAKNKNTWNKNSVAYVLERKNSKNIPKQILITTGLQDPAVLKDNQNVHKLLEKKKFKFEYEEAQGAHDWNFWTKQFSRLLRKQADFLNL